MPIAFEMLISVLLKRTVDGKLWDAIKLKLLYLKAFSLVR